MPDQETFELALDQTASYVEGIGDEVIEKNVEGIITGSVRGEQYSFTGHRCEDGKGNTYLISAHPELRFASAIYIYSLTEFVGSQLPKEVVKHIVDQVDGDTEEMDTSSMRRTAGSELLGRIDEEELAALETYVFMFVSRGTNETRIQKNDQGRLSVLGISNDFFPFEEDFSIRHFSDAVRRTVTSGQRGKRLVERTVFTDLDEKEDFGAKVRVNFGW